MDQIRLGLIGENISGLGRRLYIVLQRPSSILRFPMTLSFHLAKALISRSASHMCGIWACRGSMLHFHSSSAPFEQAMIEDNATRNLGAVNTLRFVSSGIIGYNTDYSGFKRPMSRKGEKIFPVRLL